MYQKILNVSIILVLILGFTAPVFAQSVTEYTGTVLTIDEMGGTFELSVSDTETYTVVPPAGFDLANLAEGDIVTVIGLLTDSTIEATSIVVLAVSINVTGTVYTVGAGDFVLDVSGVLYTVNLPVGFELASIQPGDMVRVVGTLQGDIITASQVLLAVEYVGTVAAVEADGSFQFQANDGPLFTVTPPDGYDGSMLMAGDVLVVRGWLEGSMIYATNISVLFAGDGEGSKGGYYCENLDDYHPVAERLAEEYGMYYEQIMSWFCVDNFGFGEIKNAFKAEMLLVDGHSVAEILAMKEALGGWGQVKQALGVIGPDKAKAEKNREEIQMVRNEKKADNGKPENPGNSDKEVGPPEHANDKVKDKDKK